MYCLQPPLYEVPEGDWYCDTCNPKGSSRHLEKYFQQHEEMYNFFCSKGNREEMYQIFFQGLKQNLQSTFKEFNFSLDGDVELSEFDFVKDKKEFIGSKMKILCLVDERYHTGRVIGVEFDEVRKNWKYLVQFKR
jgi:hypothetical protein